MAAGDLFWPAVYVAMHMDDAGLTDIKGNVFTKNGGVARSATQSKFGGYSAYFDGVDDEIVNSVELGDMYVSDQGLQFFCRPGAQTSDNPCVLRFGHLKIEYKPAGFPNGFVINGDGSRTACGTHPEDQWYFIWVKYTGNEYTLHIDGLLIGVFGFGYFYGPGTLAIGSANLADYADSAFCGYVDDLLVTGTPVYPILDSFVRTDPSVPTIAFYEHEPDPEGAASGTWSLAGAMSGEAPPAGPGVGALTFTGPSVGLIPPVGAVQGALSFYAALTGGVPCAGRVSGRIRLSGLGAGLVPNLGAGAGALRFTGTGIARLGAFGAGGGAMRLAGSGAGSHGGGGYAAGALAFTGVAVGSSTEVPVGAVSGALRVTGRALGSGGVSDQGFCQ